jgi:Zn-dependent membrane protease YugP
MLYDPLFYLFTLPGVLLALWAQHRVSSAFAAGSRIPASSGLSGAEAAARVLASGGLTGVRIEPVSGLLTDHYDPTEKVLRLSEEVYAGRSIAALGVAAHESGHAFQDAAGSLGLVVRNAIVPLASLGASVWSLVFVAGIVLRVESLIVLAIILFSLTLAVQLLNLPVEFDASRRARQALLATGLVSAEEDPVVAQVLDAAAWTYVAAALTGVLQLVYLLIRAGALDRRED